MKNQLIALLFEKWTATQYLATTKRNEATTQLGHMETDKNKNEVLVEAVKFSIMGGIMLVSGSKANPNDQARDMISKITAYLPTTYIQHWEDAKGRTKEDIIAMLEAAL